MNSPGPEKELPPKTAATQPAPAETGAQLVREPAGPAQVPAVPAGPKARGSVAKRRRNARQKAMQALYQWDFDTEANSVTAIIEQFCEFQNMERVDVDYFTEVFLYVAKNIDVVDQSIVEHTDRPLDRLDPVERSVLRVACSEFMCRLDIPYKVIVNEALEITKLFGADQGHKFVNGVVDKMAAQHRSLEYRADKPDSAGLVSAKTQDE